MINPFEYQKPNDEQLVRIERLREAYWALLQTLVEVRDGSVGVSTTACAYYSEARRQLEESAMWATKAVVFEKDKKP